MTIKYIYFSWLFFINLTVYSQQAVDTSLISKAEKAGLGLSVSAGSERDPVGVNGTLVFNKDQTQMAVIIKASMLPDWHLYAYVPETEPYIETKTVLEIPENFTPISDWYLPRPFPYEDEILIFEGDIIFTRFFAVNKMPKKGLIQAGLYYQTCDANQCLPPETKKVELKIE